MVRMVSIKMIYSTISLICLTITIFSTLFVLIHRRKHTNKLLDAGKKLFQFLLMIPIILCGFCALMIESPYYIIRNINLIKIMISFSFHQNYERYTNELREYAPNIMQLPNNIWGINPKPPIISQSYKVHKVYLSNECLICRTTFNDTAMDLGCGHLYCNECINIGTKCAACGFKKEYKYYYK